MQTFALWALPLVVPALALFICRVKAPLKALFRPASMPLAVQVAALSGLAFWIAQPFSGYSPWRYVGYAWPLAWVVVPWLLRRGAGSDETFSVASDDRILVS